MAGQGLGPTMAYERNDGHLNEGINRELLYKGQIRKMIKGHKNWVRMMD